MSHARQVLGDEEGEVHLGARQHPAARRVPLLGTLAQNRLAGHVAQRAKESSVELVVMGRTQISVRAVPAPAPMVIPEIERADQSGDSVREQLTHPALWATVGPQPTAPSSRRTAWCASQSTCRENAVKPSRSALRSQRSRLARPYQAT